MKGWYIVGGAIITIFIIVVAGLGLVDYTSLLSFFFLGGILTGVTYYAVSLEEPKSNEDMGGLKGAFLNINKLLKSMDEGEPINFKGGKQVQTETRMYTTPNGEIAKHTAVFGRTKKRRLPLLVIYDHKEEQITKTRYNPSRERQDLFKDYKPYPNTSTGTENFYDKNGFGNRRGGYNGRGEPYNPDDRGRGIDEYASSIEDEFI